MSLHVLTTGTLIADPARRTSAKGGAYATGSIRVATDDGAILISVIGFGAVVDELLHHRQGDAVAVSGRARLTSWTGRDGAEHHGLSVVVEQITSAAAARRAGADRRQRERAA